MQQTSHIGFAQAAGNALKSFFSKAFARVKSILNNETTQKVLLFVAIITLLLVAANLEAIM